MQTFYSELSEDDAEQIFNDVIFPQISKGIIPSPLPRAVIVGGQPGSGKSVFASRLLQEEPNTVFINGDDFRSLHPLYTEYLAKSSLDAADKTQEIVNLWIERALLNCVHSHLNFIVEGTMRSAKAPLATALMAKGARYVVDGAVISTPAELSLASTVFRFEEAKRKGGIARYTKKESHDEAFLALPNTVKELIESQLFSSIIIGVRQSGDFILRLYNAEEQAEVMSELQRGRDRALLREEQEFVNALLPYAEHSSEY